ncbi:E3 SUMO-protein ligase ZBED1-like [Penaeus indicus]|uniref:E3 SUMO-protein ligase ZBED1-like n=1 Tax=Penaeus indicus TaxID=29960 RepID=UPI00300CA623
MPRKASVFDHFSAPTPSGTVGNCQAKCHHCQAVIAGSVQATSNFRRHLMVGRPAVSASDSLIRKHPDIFQKLDTPTTRTSAMATPGQASSTSLFSSGGRSPKWRASDHRQEAITRSIVSVIAENLLPLDFVEGQKFMELMAKAEARYTVPSARSLSVKFVPDCVAKIQSDVEARLQHVESMCLTLDVWSSRFAHSYVAITGHFILEYMLRSVILAIRRKKEVFIMEDIFQLYQETILRYRLTGKVALIFTDNLTNLIQAFSLPGWVLLEDECLETESDELEFSVLSTEKLDFPPSHKISCYAHSLQLVVQDGLSAVADSFRDIISRASELVFFCRKSSLVVEGLTERQTKQNVWNCQLRLLRSVISLPRETLIRLGASVAFSSSDLKLIEELCTILEPFEEVLDKIQHEKAVTASLVLVCTKGLRSSLRELEATFNNKLVTNLQLSLEERLSSYEEMEYFQLAAMLDPRFKADWCQEGGVQEMKRLLLAAVSATSEAPPAPSAPTRVQPSPPPIKRNRLFAFMSSRPGRRPPPSANPSSASPDSPPKAEVSQYLEEPCLPEDADPLAYWRAKEGALPLLAGLAHKYLAAPGGCAPVERIVGVGGRGWRPGQSPLSDSSFEELMLIRCSDG